MNYLLGLDVGGTKIEAALLKVEGDEIPSVLGKKRIPTDRHLGYEKVISNMATLIEQICNEHDVSISSLKGIGAGLPGTIDPSSQKMLNGNTGIFIGQDFTVDLQKKLNSNIKIYVENDASLFAFAEVFAGVGKSFEIPFEKQIGIGIILGTGCGGGVVLNGNILQGKNGGGAELGHTSLIPDGHSCYCGSFGCAEQYLSGPAIESMYARRIYSQIDKRPASREVFEMLKRHEPMAQAVVHEYKRNLVRFLVNLTNIFNPHYFVLGGGVSNEGIIYDGLEEEVARKSFIKTAAPKILKNKLGDSAGVVGAALLPLIRS